MSVGVLVRPLLNLSGSHSREGKMPGLLVQTVQTMLGHGVGQARDASDETQVELAANSLQ